MRFRGGGARDGDVAGRVVRPGDNVGEPRVEPVGCGVHGCVWAVDGDAGFGEVEERCLLGVFVGD